MLDAGAVKALREQGKSLLPIGVYDVTGEFERGEVVGCCDADGCGDRARARQLQRKRDAAHSQNTFERNRGEARLRGRAGTHPSRQPGPVIGRPLAA